MKYPFVPKVFGMRYLISPLPRATVIFVKGFVVVGKLNNQLATGFGFSLLH
jgi:hypothetical protein